MNYVNDNKKKTTSHAFPYTESRESKKTIRSKKKKMMKKKKKKKRFGSLGTKGGSEGGKEEGGREASGPEEWGRL